MFKGRGKRNMTTNWRDTGRDGASFVTTSNNNFDGGAPLHSPVGDVTPRRGDPKLVVADRHQASVVSDCDTDSTGGIPVTIRKVTNKGKHKGEGRAATSTHKGNMKAGSDEIDTATQKTNMANFAHHQLGIQSGDVSLRNGHVDGVADQLGQGKPIPNLNITNMPNDTHSPLAVQHVPSSHVKNDTTQTKLDMVPKTLSKQTDVTTRSKLSPIAETFVPCNLPVQIMQVQNGIADNVMNDHAARSNAAYDLLMQKLMKKYPKADEFEVQQCAISARGQLSHSHTCYAGLDLTQIEQAGSLQRVPKITQPMLYGSASTGSGLGQQDPTVYGLRVSHTEPHIKDPHSVAAILNDDSAYGSYASTPHGIHHQRSNDNATIPRPAQHRATGCYEMATNATNQQVTQYNRPASNSVHQQIPFLNGLALNPANYRAGVPSQAMEANRSHSQTVTNHMDGSIGNAPPSAFGQVPCGAFTPVPTGLVSSNNELVPPSQQFVPGECNAITQEWTPRQQDLPPLAALEVLHGELFRPPTEQEVVTRSQQLNELIGRSGMPSVHAMLDPRKIPFTENCALITRNRTAGVLKITNTPFNVTRNELVAIFGCQGKLLNDNEEPIHIILEKVSAKTQDAYAEFETEEDARRAFVRIEENIARGRVPRIGPRQVKVEFSSQSALMQELFPVARGVTWDNANPVIRTDSPFAIENFKCFISEEECTQICRHFELPGRKLVVNMLTITENQSPFSRDCPERFVESMISTLKKLPWHMSSYITIHQQAYLYDACQRLMEVLIEELDPAVQARKADRHKRLGIERLTPQLLRRYANAIMLCPGFTVVQKDNIASMVKMNEMDMRDFNMPRNAQSWNHLYALGPKPGVPCDVLEYYISIIRQESNRYIANFDIHTKRQLADLADRTDGECFGHFWREVNWPRGEAMDNMTLYDAALREWRAIESVIRRALATGNAKVDGDVANRHEPLQIAGPPCAGLLTY